MAWELFYTSAARGLRAGSRGYCTVAASEGMPADLVGRLESLSGYRPAFPAGSPGEARNPVLYAHWRVAVAGRNRSVLSRVAPAGLDYSRRPNTLAYHLVLEASEQAPNGPVWVMSRPNVLRREWAGEPQRLQARRLTLAPDDGLAGRSAEEGTEGARRLSEAFLLDPAKPSYVLFEPGTELLPLLAAAMQLIPPALRWQVTFNTHFTEPPAGLTCAWRCVAAGTPAERLARRHAPPGGVFLDLTRTADRHALTATVDHSARRGESGRPAPQEPAGGGHG